MFDAGLIAQLRKARRAADRRRLDANRRAKPLAILARRVESPSQHDRFPEFRLRRRIPRDEREATHRIADCQPNPSPAAIGNML
jgi:hypothetical protein